MKNFLWVGLMAMGLLLFYQRLEAQASLSEFENLYPGCVDNEESTIYGGTYGEWPRDLVLPEFPGGGDVQFTRFVSSNIEYPEVIESIEYVRDEKDSTKIRDSVVHLAKGIVAVQIVIDRCGRATRQEIIQSVNDKYDEEALRIMNGLPIFRPADLNGERVKVALIVPVYFTRTKMPKVESDYVDFGDDNYNFDDW